MGNISIVYNIDRNIISGSIILRYVNVVRTPDFIMCYGTDGLITTTHKKYHIHHITNFKTMSHTDMLIAI